MQTRMSEELQTIVNDDWMNSFDAFDNLTTQERKVLWLLLKSQYDPGVKQMLSGCLAVIQCEAESYASFLEKLNSHLTEAVLESLRPQLDRLDCIVTLTRFDFFNFKEVDVALSNILDENDSLQTFLSMELLQNNSTLRDLLKTFTNYLLKGEVSRRARVVTYFSSLKAETKNTLFEMLRLPFAHKESRTNVDNWLQQGYGLQYYDFVMQIDKKIGELTQKNFNCYRVALQDLTELDDPEEKLLTYLANNIHLFEFLVSELEKPASNLLKLINAYRQFTNPLDIGNENTLRQLYDKKHPQLASAKVLPSMSIFPSTKQSLNTINVRSVGFDDCLFHEGYSAAYHGINKHGAIIYKNAIFFEHLSESIKRSDFKKVIFMNGSLRQSYKADEFCCLRKIPGIQGYLRSESMLTAFPAIVNYTEMLLNKKFILDNFLLTDMFNGFVDGTAYNEAVKKQYDSEYDSFVIDALCVNDESKVILLLAQMQKIANENALQNIQFDFYSGNLNEIKKIFLFFINHRDLKPNNVLLNLYFYNGIDIQLKNTVDCFMSTSVDLQYKDHLKAMVNSCCSVSDKNPFEDKDNVRGRRALASRNTSLPATITLDFSTDYDASRYRQQQQGGCEPSQALPPGMGLHRRKGG